MRKPRITYRMEPKNLAALRVETPPDGTEREDYRPIFWPKDRFEFDDPDEQPLQSDADATDCLVAAAFEAATSAAMRRRMQHGQALAVVILVPSPAWVGPTAHHFGQAFGDRWRLVRASSTVRLGAEVGVAAELSGGQSVAGISADIDHLPRSLTLSADMTIRIDPTSPTVLSNAIRRFTNRRATAEDLPAGLDLDLPAIVACFRPGTGPRRIAQRLVAAEALNRPARKRELTPTNPPPPCPTQGDPTMLTVHIQLVPGGVEPLKRTVGTMQIANITGLSDISSYRITATEAANSLTGHPARIAEVTLEGHDRHQNLWKIIKAAADRIEDADWVAL